jgi:putative membrane protein
VSTITRPTSPPRRRLKDYVGITARGFAMGTADIIPGVSGGTMAFILGIYEELLDAIKSFDLELVRRLFRFDLRAVMAKIPWRFLCSLVVGIGLAVFLLSEFLETQLETHPSLVWAFFFGLVLASAITVGRVVKRWNAAAIVSVVLGVAFGYMLVGAVPVQTPESFWFLFLCGALAICAMILPGISGAFILVLLGKYQYVLAAVNDRDFLTLGIVAAGAVIGLLSFVRFLSWLFKRHHDPTVALLLGLMLGSLRKVWPWKETLSTALDRHGKVVPLDQVNRLPAGFDLDVGFAVALAIIGFAAVMIMSWMANRRAGGAGGAATDSSS